VPGLELVFGVCRWGWVAELKNRIGLRGLRLRRPKFVRDQFFLAAAKQNIKRLVLILSEAPSPNSLQPLSQLTKTYGSASV